MFHQNITAGFVAVLIICPFLYAAADWQDLPSVIISECSKVDNAIAPNPFSNRIDEFILVLHYQAREASEDLKSLVLVVSFHDSQAREAIVDAQSLLVTSGNTQHMLYWVISDVNGDGIVDKGTHLGKEKGLTMYEVDAPLSLLTSLQTFFDDASATLYDKVNNPPATKCR